MVRDLEKVQVIILKLEQTSSFHKEMKKYQAKGVRKDHQWDKRKLSRRKLAVCFQLFFNEKWFSACLQLVTLFCLFAANHTDSSYILLTTKFLLFGC